MDIKAAAEFVLGTLHKSGFEAFLVGGCVRDVIMGNPPKDFDITTNAAPEQVAPLFEKTIPVGAKFGVVVVMVEGHQLEVATFRADGDYSDGRRPDTVSYSNSAKEDVTRRDFTMNGLVSVTTLEMTEASNHMVAGAAVKVVDGGVVIDYVDGLADIKAKVIRCIGDPNKRFEEDALRMLRAVRFAAQLGFEIESNTYAAICANVDSIKNISRERIAMELFKLVSAPYPLKGLVPLLLTGLYRKIFGDKFTFSTKFQFTVERFAKFPTKDPILGMAMLLADSINVTAFEVLDSLKLSSEDNNKIAGAISNRLVDMYGVADSTVKRMARVTGVLPYGVDLFEQNVAMGITPMGVEAGMSIVTRFRALTPEEINPVPLVTGNDLIAMGRNPSPLFTKVLEAVETKQLNGEFKSKQEALDYAGTISFWGTV